MVGRVSAPLRIKIERLARAGRTDRAVVFHVTEDGAITMESAEHLAAGLPGCDGVIVIHGAAHASNMTRAFQN